MRTVNIDYLKRRILKNKKTFLAMEKAVAQEKDLRKQAELAYETATFAVLHTTDVFSSPIIENVFLKIARSHTVDLSENHVADTVLHVMTEAYVSGGHTRCVERWISQFPEHKHSCVVLAQKAVFPDKLKEIVEKSGGELTLYNITDSMIKRALDLRQYASKFEYIVLHIHMNDPIALIAFGTESFKRPVIFFNHADHAFWLGVSVSDYVADLNTDRNTLSFEKRGVKNASVLGIPLDNTPLLTIAKADAREKLGIDKDKKVIFSSGSATKYNPIDSLSFYSIISDMVTADSNIVFYVAGANADQIFWPALKKKFPNNLILTGTLDYATQYPLYLSAADLVFDSYPVGGETSMIDAVKAGKPILTMNKLQADYLVNSSAYCRTYQDFLEKAHQILNNGQFAAEIYQEVYQKFEQETNPDIWREKCKGILSQLQNHKITAFERPQLDYDITSVSLDTCRWTEPVLSGKQLLKKVKRFLFQVRLRKHEKIIRILGFYLLNRKVRVYDNKTTNHYI